MSNTPSRFDRHAQRPSQDRPLRAKRGLFEQLDPRLMLSIYDRVELLNPGGPIGPAGEATATLEQLYRISDDLVDIYASEVRGLTAPTATTGFTPFETPLIRDAEGRVAVTVTATDVALLQPLVEDLGLVVSAALPDHHLIEGYLPLTELLDAVTLTTSGLLGISGIAQPMTSVGLAQNEADYTLQAERVRATLPPGYDGAGVTIGVLSDSYNNKGGAAAGIASGDLPATLVMNRDAVSGGSDEGRGMMELVHDVAPGAPKAFATANGGEAAFAQNIRDLAAPTKAGGAGASVIVDDIFYFAEPMFQDGIIAQAIDDVVTDNGVAYFSSAGNLEDQAYENTNPTFVTTTISAISAAPAKYLQFSPGIVTQNVTTNNQTLLIGTQWSDPFYTAGGVKSNVDVFFLANGGVLTSSTANNIATNIPNEILGVTGTGTLQIVVRLTSGDTPTRLKWVNFGSNQSGPVTIQFATGSSTITPHSAAESAMSVGASPMFDQRTPEAFSSKGPSTILFDAAGAAIPAAVRAKPDILATDGVSTSFFGATVGGIPHPLFFGTSAAAPNAAAVAALVRQANPGFTPTQVYARLESTARTDVSGGVEYVGAGLVDAYRAIFGNPVADSAPSSGGFESGTLDQSWDVWNTGTARTRVSTDNGPASGTHHLVLDSNLPVGFNNMGLGEAILHVNLAGQTNATLDFDAKLFSSELLEAMPASFSGHNNSDGVALSVDGVNWFLVSDLTGLTTTYSSRSINLNAVAAAAGVILSADTQIKFQRYGGASGQAPSQGLAFDNISVSNKPTPIAGLTEIQAEFFSRRQAGAGHVWSIVNQEVAGAGSFSGATGPSSDFLQSLTTAGQDSNVANLTPSAPYVEYDIQVPVTGDYELMLKVAGLSGNSDSLWVEASTGTLADAQGNVASGNALMITTNRSGAFGSLNAGRWTLGAGTHTIRVSMRESGTAIDALQIVPPSTPGIGVLILNDTLIQAEDFARRQVGVGHQWSTVDLETAGAGVFTGASGASGDYLQSLTAAGQDSSAVNLAPAAPYVEFDLLIPFAGQFDILVQAAGISGSSDSLWVTTTGTLSDAQGNAVTGSGLLINTDRTGAFETLSAGRWTLSNGTNIVRIAMRESGTAIDALRIVPVSTPGTGVPVSGLTEIQAENFVRRQSGGGHQWSIVDQEVLGAGAFSAATGDYLQALNVAGQDTPLANTTPAAPYIEFDIQVSQTGVFDLELKVAGISSASDSLWVDLPTGVLSDAQGNAATGAALKIETNSTGVFTLKNAGRWNLTAGVHTIRISMRESGAAIDSLQIVPVV